MYQFPVATYNLGLKFGSPYGSMLSKLLGNKHWGTDLLPKGDFNVKPMDAGTVVNAVMGAGDCGGLVDIDYGFGIRSRYCHLKQINVRKGDRVTLATIVGIMGGTGTSYPRGYVHLHWVVWRNGRLIDPLSLPYGSVTEPAPLITRVNELFGRVWGRAPAPKESGYFQHRVTKDINTVEKLISTMEFWHEQSRIAFIIEMQKNGFF